MKDRRRIQRIVLVLGSLLVPGVALANQPPAFQLAMATLIALPLMMVLTLLGGGYAVMREREKGPRRWTLLPGFLAALVAIVFAATHESAAVMVLFVFTLIAVARGCMMLWWGLRLRGGGGIRKYRLMAGGPCMVFGSIVLFAFSASFHAWRPNVAEVEEELQKLVAYQQVVAEQNRAQHTVPLYEQPTKGDDELRFEGWTANLRPVGIGGSATGSRQFETEFLLGPGGDSFEVRIWPRRIPLGQSLPSFYADETGELRMVRVRHANERCPENAPVYYKVTETDRQRWFPQAKTAAGPA
jgi:uncharacterized membrane protein HdeD (DUF308 family)